MINEITAEEAIKIIKSLEFYDRLFDNTCEQSKTKIALLMAIESLEQQPFINKPCISEGICREDKIQVLDKMRAEIKKWYWQADKQALAKDPCVVDAMVDLFIRTIDKYKAESEDAK